MGAAFKKGIYLSSKKGEEYASAVFIFKNPHKVRGFDFLLILGNYYDFILVNKMKSIPRKRNNKTEDNVDKEKTKEKKCRIKKHELW